MKDPPDLKSVLRDQAFEEIRQVSGLTESYSRSISEAAFRGDEATVRAHLSQLRACLMAMIQTYKDYIEGRGDGQGVSAKDGSQPDRPNQRSGDGVA